MNFLSKVLYKYLGPTAIHLQHELILLATLCIFTSASFYATYHSNKSIFHSASSSSSTSSSSPHYNIVDQTINLDFHRNECLYIFFSTIWLARHLLHRIICTTEVNTSILTNRTLTKRSHYQIHPTFLSTLYKIYIWLSCDGQYFDIPFCPLNLATHEEDTSTSITSTTKTNNTSSSGGVNSNKLRIMIQIPNIKSPPGIHHHNHHLHATESLLHRKTPPLHRIYIIQLLFIIPFLVIPISIMKYLFNLLRSRKRPNHKKYYDSDDDDDFNNHNSSNSHKNKHHTNTSFSTTSSSNNNSNPNNHHSFNSSLSSTTPFSSDDDILLWDNDNINDEYIHIYLKTQRRINNNLDSIWNYIPSMQCILYVVILILMLHIGMKFYSTYMHNRYYDRTISSNNGLFYLDKKMNDLHLNNILTPQQQLQQQQQLESQNHKLSALGVQNGFHSTALNSKLMEYKFKVKQHNYFGGISTSTTSGSSSSGSNRRSNRNSETNLRVKELLYNYCLTFSSMVADKIGIPNWLVALYGPWGMSYLMMVWGIVGSLLFFGRIMLPIPDLTAGGRDNGRGSNVSGVSIVTNECINLNTFFFVSFIFLTLNLSQSILLHVLLNVEIT